IRNRSTMLGRMQVGEFSSIIGLIKRTHQLYGRMMTVSGVMAMFRKRALEEVGYWSPEMLTEDIDITWKLQLGGWQVRYEPRALSWILMPETFKGLYKQRLRWAKGGLQTALKYAPRLLDPRQALMWPILLEFLASVAWAYCMLGIVVVSVAGLIIEMPTLWRFDIVPGWHGTLLFLTCLTQLLVGCLIDHKYDYRIFRYFTDTVWYPVAFWLLGMATTVVALPGVLLRTTHKRARWVSPDRGIKYENPDHRRQRRDLSRLRTAIRKAGRHPVRMLVSHRPPGHGGHDVVAVRPVHLPLPGHGWRHGCADRGTDRL